MAAIITLIRDELNKPGDAYEGEVVSYLDLFTGTVAFVLLQRWGRRKTELDFRVAGGEEVIWDTVIDDRGFRADVVGTRRRGYSDVDPDPAGMARKGRAMSFLSPMGDEEIEALERATIHDTATLGLSPQDQTQLSDEEVRAHIMSQLPQGAHAVITSETITAKTIKVEIYDVPMADVTAPPGTILVTERFPRAEAPQLDGLPQQTVVFRTALKRSSSADIEPAEKLRLTSNDHTPSEALDGDDVVMMDIRTGPGRGPEEEEAEDFIMAGTDSESETIAEPQSTPVQARLLSTVSPMSRMANQKKSRIPVGSNMDGTNQAKTSFAQSTRSRFTSKAKSNGADRSEKDGPLKRALKSLSPSQSATAVNDLAGKPARTSNGVHATPRSASKIPSSSIPRMTSTTASPKQALPVSPQKPRPSNRNSTNANLLAVSRARPTSKQSFYAVHEKRRDSVVSESYSTHSIESRPGSPTFTRTHVRSVSGLTKSRSEMDIAVWDGTNDDNVISEDHKHHRRSKSVVPSLYSMGTKGSQEALILAPKTPIPRDSVFDDHHTLAALIQDGKNQGAFPNQHMVRNVRRFARFSSASYGSHFLRLMGLTAEANASASTSAELPTEDIHHEHSSFSNYSGLPTDTILLSSFVDPQGVGASGSSQSIISPLVHFICIDHDSQAVVLTCRGTLGFEDVLTDMLCDYDELRWQNQAYQVHKGIHASARRLLAGIGSRVMATLKAALEEYPDFGLVLCGHSLGGAVAAVLAILISEPSEVETSGALFVTAPFLKLLEHPNYQPEFPTAAPITLPAGRRIHVYAYGTPATLSPSLRLATRGLITTIVNSADIVPSLSIGTLHDFRAVALNLKTDTSGALNSLKARIMQRIKHALANVFYVDAGPPPPENLAGDGLGEDTWAWSALKTLRAAMQNPKLVPPGEIFVVETTRVFDRQAGSPGSAVPDNATERVFKSLGRPATRVQLKFIRDVETRFGELRFGSNMFSDHSPGRYEASLAALEKGILE